MTFGLNVYNSSGNVIMDTDLPQMPFVQSGSASANSIAVATAPTFVSFSSLAAPVLYVRPQTTGGFVMIGNILTNGFFYKSNSNIDWRVYDGSVSSWTPSSNFGMNVYNSSGSLLYNTNKNPPFIRLITTGIPSSYTGSATNDTTINTISFSFTAYDGGLPFVSASTLQSCAILAGPGLFLTSCCAANFTSSTSLRLSQYQFFIAGSNPIGASGFTSGQIPRTILMIK
jgi:hypothetical protein